MLWSLQIRTEQWLSFTYWPVSQWSPTKFGGQSHLYELFGISSLHVPPFRHLVLSHIESAIQQRDYYVLTSYVLSHNCLLICRVVNIAIFAISIAIPYCNTTCQCCCQGLETQGRWQGQGLEYWSSRILKNKDFPRGQQHCKHRVSNKHPHLLQIQRCQSTSHTLVTP